jgi:ATP-dependent Clp protease ATP-binding subunit ClpA
MTNLIKIRILDYMKTSRKQFKLDDSSNAIKNLINIELKKFFHPEFLNRRDEIIIFNR